MSSNWSESKCSVTLEQKAFKKLAPSFFLLHT
jgi:hypothetical protein